MRGVLHFMEAVLVVVIFIITYAIIADIRRK